MFEQVTGFDKDDGNRPKCRKHGLSREEIESFFRMDITVYDDVSHSHAELRFKAIGQTTQRRFAFVSSTLRYQGERLLIRPISARYMHQQEVRTYVEEDTSGAAKR